MYPSCSFCIDRIRIKLCIGGSEKNRFVTCIERRESVSNLTAETVEGTALTLQGVDDIHGGDGLPFRVLGVGDGVTDHVLEEHLQHATCLLVDKAGYTLDTATTSETADRRLRDALDVIAQDFTMTFRATLSEPLASLSATGHDDDDAGGEDEEQRTRRDVHSATVDERMSLDSYDDGVYMPAVVIVRRRQSFSTYPERAFRLPSVRRHILSPHPRFERIHSPTVVA